MIWVFWSSAWWHHCPCSVNILSCVSSLFLVHLTYPVLSYACSCACRPPSEHPSAEFLQRQAGKGFSIASCTVMSPAPLRVPGSEDTAVTKTLVPRKLCWLLNTSDLQVAEMLPYLEELGRCSPVRRLGWLMHKDALGSEWRLSEGWGFVFLAHCCVTSTQNHARHTVGFQ